MAQPAIAVAAKPAKVRVKRAPVKALTTAATPASATAYHPYPAAPPLMPELALPPPLAAALPLPAKALAVPSEVARPLIKTAKTVKASVRRKAAAKTSQPADGVKRTTAKITKAKAAKSKTATPKSRTTKAKTAKRKATKPAAVAKASRALPAAPGAETVAAPPERKLTLVERARLAPVEPALMPKASPPALTLPALAEALVAQAAAPSPPLTRAEAPAVAAPLAKPSAPSRETGPTNGYAWTAPAAGSTALPSASNDLPEHPALAGRGILTRMFGVEDHSTPLPRNLAPARPPSGLASAIGAWLKSAASLFRLGMLRRPAAPVRRAPPAYTQLVPAAVATPAPPTPAEAPEAAGTPQTLSSEAPAKASEVQELRAENAELRARLDALLDRLEREKAL